MFCICIMVLPRILCALDKRVPSNHSSPDNQRFYCPGVLVIWLLWFYQKILWNTTLKYSHQKWRYPFVEISPLVFNDAQLYLDLCGENWLGKKPFWHFFSRKTYFSLLNIAFIIRFSFSPFFSTVTKNWKTISVTFCQMYTRKRNTSLENEIQTREKTFSRKQIFLSAKWPQRIYALWTITIPPIIGNWVGSNGSNWFKFSQADLGWGEPSDSEPQLN